MKHFCSAVICVCSLCRRRYSGFFSRLIVRLLLSVSLLLGGSLSFSLFGQHDSVSSLSRLQTKKRQADEEIRNIKGLLDKKGKAEKETLNRLNLLNRMIENRNIVILGINAEIAFLDSCIAENVHVMGMLTADLEKLRNEYAETLRWMQKNKNSHDILLFMLSAESINQAFNRALYLKRFTAYRKTQAEVIASISHIIDEKVKKLEDRKKQKLELAEQKKEDNERLEEEKDEQGTVVGVLRQQQEELKKRLYEHEAAQEVLNRAIEALLREEGFAAGEEETSPLTAGREILSYDFANNKGRLPWPVAKGVITGSFGIHPHPVMTHVKIRNNGIDITTEGAVAARAVFGGEVSRIFAVSAGTLAVIIRHGDFLTVYSNLKDVYVKTGQIVSSGEDVGEVLYDDAFNGKGVLKFQIWRGNTKLDPAEWLGNR